MGGASIVLLVRHGSLRDVRPLLYTFYFLIVTGLAAVPSDLGRQEGNRDRDPERTQLPFVSLESGPDSSSYLVRCGPDVAYVMTTPSREVPPTFRAVPADRIKSISAIGDQFAPNMKKPSVSGKP